MSNISLEVVCHAADGHWWPRISVAGLDNRFGTKVSYRSIYVLEEKNRIRETKNLSTDANSSTDTFCFPPTLKRAVKKIKKMGGGWLTNERP